MSTDYNCRKEDEAPVTWEEILAVFDQNAHNVYTQIAEELSGILRYPFFDKKETSYLIAMEW